jgi:hypothetical protein
VCTDPLAKLHSLQGQSRCLKSQICRYIVVNHLDTERIGRFRCRLCYHYTVDWGVLCSANKFFRRLHSRTGNFHSGMSPSIKLLKIKVHLQGDEQYEPTLEFTHSTFGETLHPPLLFSHSSMSTHEKPLPEYPAGQGPQTNAPGVLIHRTFGSIEQCGRISLHSSTSTVQLIVSLDFRQPCSQMQVYPSLFLV